MKKLNSVIYHKLLLQAEEAKEQKMHKLSNAIMNTLGSYPEEEVTTYASSEMENDVYNELWKLASFVLKYHNVSSVNAEKLNETIESLASKVITEIEDSLNIEEPRIGPLEPPIPGVLIISDI